MKTKTEPKDASYGPSEPAPSREHPGGESAGGPEASVPEDSRQKRRGHPKGIARVFVLFGALAAAGAVPYLLPADIIRQWGIEEDVGRLEAWKEGSAVPFSRFLDFRPPTRPRLAGVEERERASIDDDQELLAAAPLPEAAEQVEVPAASPGVEPAIRILPEEYEGMTQAVEDPDGALKHFYDRLIAVVDGQPSTLARVLLYSDSINGSDRVSSALRSLFAERFGDGGKGWVPISPGWQYQRHHDVEWSQAGGWHVSVVNRGEREDGRYGLGGVLALNRSAASRAVFSTVADGTVGQSVARFGVFHHAWPEGGTLTLTLDGQPLEPLSLWAEAPIDRVFDVLAPEGPHSLEVRVGDGDVRLYGVVMEREQPGVVVDGLMLIGAYTRVLHKFDEAHWANQLRLREPDLLIFWLGGNDSVSEAVPFEADRYPDDYAEVLRRARAGRPDASCLVMSVLDSAERIDGVVRSRRVVRQVVEAQRGVARRAGCAFFDGYEAIGGYGTMARWHRASPRLVSVDYRHLTPEGARVVATLLYKALLRGLAEHVAEPESQSSDSLQARPSPATAATKSSHTPPGAESGSR